MQRNNRIEYVFFRDSIVGKDKAFVSLTSTLAQYGLNVFEGVRGYYNRDTNDLYIFRLHDHVDRLFRSAKMLRSTRTAIWAPSVEKAEYSPIFPTIIGVGSIQAIPYTSP